MFSVRCNNCTKPWLKDWKKFEKNKKSTSLNVLFVEYNIEEIKQTCISKHNSEHEYKVIILMITNSKKWYYLAIKNCLHFFK